MLGLWTLDLEAHGPEASMAAVSKSIRAADGDAAGAGSLALNLNGPGDVKTVRSACFSPDGGLVAFSLGETVTIGSVAEDAPARHFELSGEGPAEVRFGSKNQLRVAQSDRLLAYRVDPGSRPADRESASGR